MGLSDGLQHLGYAARVSLANSVSRQPVAPELVYDAPCFVAEPVPPQNHYPLAVALSTFSGRRWMAALSVEHWVHRYPHLVVSDWEDDDATGLVGMRWGTGFTWRGLAPVLCLTDALCGRFDWVLFCDDDTAIDGAALDALVAGRLAAADVSAPHFLSFAPQPFPSRRDWQWSMHGCLSWLPNASATNCRRSSCRAQPDLTRACTGAAQLLSSPQSNLHSMWPYGGLGFLLSRGAAAALQEGTHSGAGEAEPAGGVPSASSFRYDADGAHFTPPMAGASERQRRAGATFGAAARRHRSCRTAAPIAVAAAERGAARGSMRAHANPRTFSCLRELTCPWGQYRECMTLPPPFNHTPSREQPAGRGGGAGRGGRADGGGRAERRGFCAQKHTRQLSADCRACGGPDVQLSCCLASLGVYMTDLSQVSESKLP